MSRNVIKSITSRYGSEFIGHLELIKGEKYIKDKAEHVSKIDRKQDAAEDEKKKVKLRHVSYLNLHNNNTSLKELVSYEIGKNGTPSDLITSFEFVATQFENIKNEHGSYAWFVNLVDPKSYFTDPQWQKQYISRILKNTINKKKIDIRRVHVFLKDDYNANSKKEINTMLFIEQLFGVDNKIIIADKVKDIKTVSHEIGLHIEEVFLLDYCIFCSHHTENNYFEPTNKKVLCSDIIPYFYNSELNDEEWVKIYMLTDHNSFNIFKENFYTLWHLPQYLFLRNSSTSSSLKAYSFFELIRKSYMEDYELNWEKITSIYASTLDKCVLSGDNDLMSKELKDKFHRFEFEIRSSVEDDTKARDIFDNLFEQYIQKNVTYN